MSNTEYPMIKEGSLAPFLTVCVHFFALESLVIVFFEYPISNKE